MLASDQVLYQLMLPKALAQRFERLAAFVKGVGRMLASGRRPLHPEERP